MKRKGLKIACLAIVFYMLLLLLLTLAEGRSPDANIHSLSDAFWYSWVTMTTVGYGDYYPVTLLGRFAGFFFLLASAGLLAVIISCITALLFGRMFPRLRLRFCRNRDWQIFSSTNEENQLLAEHFPQSKKNVLIFADSPDSNSLSADLKAAGALALPLSVPELCQKRPRSCTAFFLGPDGDRMLSEALYTAELGAQVYLQSESFPCEESQKLQIFSLLRSRSRLYWQQHPLRPEENTLVFIGSGELLCQLLEQAFQVNVFPAPRRISYHVFGPADDFLALHPRLSSMLSVNEASKEKDAIFFHENWAADDEALIQADRLILCSTSAQKNRTELQHLRQYVPLTAPVHAYTDTTLSDDSSQDTVWFGAREELFTPENITRRQLEATAVQMHQIYCRDSGQDMPWATLSDFLRQSNLSAADHLLTKLQILLPEEFPKRLTREIGQRAASRFAAATEAEHQEYRRIEHERWLRFHYLHNWQYAPARDNQKRRHPLIVPFEALSPEEQRKDDYAWELIGVLAEDSKTPVH